jgi:hypothetical protein
MYGGALRSRSHTDLRKPRPCVDRHVCVPLTAWPRRPGAPAFGWPPNSKPSGVGRHVGGPLTAWPRRPRAPAFGWPPNSKPTLIDTPSDEAAAAMSVGTI